MSGEKLMHIDGELVPLRACMPLGMSWVGWLNFLLLQWFGVRLTWKPTVEDGGVVVRLHGAYLQWPLVGWYWSWRTEIIVPCLLSIPVLLAIAAILWNLL